MNKTKLLVGLFVLSLWLIFCIGWVILQYVLRSDSVDVGQKYVDDGLIFAHTVCRHGDRNIYRSYKTDPWNSEEYFPGGFGALTNVGKRESYILGQYLRKRYAKLLENDQYSPTKVYIRSTDVDRVLMSASACLAGLFPPIGSQRWSKDLDWQPIPIHTVPQIQDYILSSDVPCNRFDNEMAEYVNSTEYKTMMVKHQPLIKYLEENSGLELETLTDLNHLYDKLFIELLKGYRLPLWAQETMKSGGDFEYLAKFSYSIYTHTTAMKKLRSGFLLKEILDRFTDKLELSLSPDRSVWMYFAHDYTIADLLSSFGLFELHRPPYTSCLFFELYKTNTENYVQLFYRNSSETNIPALDIPNCGSKCSLEKWRELYKDILPTNSFGKDCDVKD